MIEVELKAHAEDPAVYRDRLAQLCTGLNNACPAGETDSRAGENAPRTDLQLTGFSYAGQLFKQDTYWTDGTIKFRIREETDGNANTKILVTYKQKEVRGDTEVNEEKEFSVDNRLALESLMSDSGFAPCMTKNKKTEVWQCRAEFDSESTIPVTIELSKVGPLGWFLEIEALCADGSAEADIEQARNAVKETVRCLGIPESAIEKRYYSEMLAEC